MKQFLYLGLPVMSFLSLLFRRWTPMLVFHSRRWATNSFRFVIYITFISVYDCGRRFIFSGLGYCLYVSLHRYHSWTGNFLIDFMFYFEKELYFFFWQYSLFWVNDFNRHYSFSWKFKNSCDFRIYFIHNN